MNATDIMGFFFCGLVAVAIASYMGTVWGMSQFELVDEEETEIEVKMREF